MSSDFSDLPEAPQGSIRARLIGSHLFIASLGMVLLVAALYLLYYISNQAEDIAGKLGPESESYLHVLSGVERSVADVFAFTVLKDDAFRRNKTGRWRNEVIPAMERLDSLTSSGDAYHAALENQLVRLDRALQRAEDLAASSENIPAEVIYMNEIRPLLDTLKSNLLSAREQARQQQPDWLLENISYAWGAVSVSEGAVRDFLQFGSPGEDMLFQYWTDETARVLDDMAANLPPDDSLPIAEVRAVLDQYREACARAIAARKAPDWNRALYVFENEVIPLAEAVIDRLQSRAFLRSSETLEMARRVHQVARRALIGLLVAGGLLALFGVWISGRQSDQIAGPLIELAQAARDLADEKFTRDLDVSRNDEIGYVVATFNAMRRTLRTRRLEIAAAQDALRTSEERYRVMVEISPTPYLAVSGGRIVYRNGAAEALFGNLSGSLAAEDSVPLSDVLGTDAAEVLETYIAGLAGAEGEGPPLTLRTELASKFRHLELRGVRFRLSDRDTVLLSIQDVTAQKKTERRLRRLSDVDALTGVPNRRALDDRLEALWMNACKAELPVSFILVDIDYFKRYNDNYGHQAGGDCLRRVAQLLHDSIRTSGDMLARYGGEEFAFLLPDTPIESAIAVARRALGVVRDAAIPHAYSDVSGHVTISLGAYTTVPTTTVTMDTLIKEADRALYQAKERGRNQVVQAGS